jgi:hypothetical protein
VRQEIALARKEIQEDLAKARTSAILLGVGAALVAVSLLFLGFMLVHLLNLWIPDLWLCFAIVGGALSLVGAGMVAGGVYLLSRLRLPIPQTARALAAEDNEQPRSSAVPAA